MLDERERLGFGEAAGVDEQALRPIDDLAGGELLLERFGELGQRPQFAEAPDRHFDGRHQLAALEGLDEIGEGSGVAGPLDEIALAERREDEDRTDPVPGEFAGHLESIETGHLDVEDGEVGSQFAGEGDCLVAASGLADDQVALLLEGLLQIEADDRLILGEHDSDRHRLPLRSARAVAGTRQDRTGRRVLVSPSMR